MLNGCLDRLNVVLAEEAIALKNISAADIRQINLRKSAVLLELDRGMKYLDTSEMSPRLIERLRGARAQLEGNLRDISLHLSALNGIMNVVRKSAERNEADGTYSRTSKWDEWQC